MCRALRLSVLIVCFSFCLSACGAGNPGNEGGDNRWTGPELAIQVPANGTTVQTRTPMLHFHLRALKDLAKLRVFYSIDGGGLLVNPDATKPVLIEKPLAPGTHLVQAYVGDENGTPVPGPHAAAIAEFHVQVVEGGSTLGGDSDAYDHRDAEGFLQDFDPARAALIVVPSAGGVWVLLTGSDAHLDGEHRRVRAKTATGDVVLGESPDARHGGLIPGQVEAVFLEERVGEGDEAKWVTAPGSRSSWKPNTP